MPLPRRRFLSWLGSASLLGAASTPTLAHAAPRRRDDFSIHDHAPPVAETWDMSWTDRVTGRYKAVFDSPESSSGAALFRAVAWREQYKEVYNTEPAETSAIVVLRHTGFYLALNDEYWSRFEVGKQLKERDDKGKKWAMVNPLGATAAAASPQSAKYSIPSFISAGGIVLVCGWSFGGAVARVMKEEKLEREAARARAKELLIPGVILQPNGIFAALRAQEAGCSYVMAS